MEKIGNLLDESAEKSPEGEKPLEPSEFSQEQKPPQVDRALKLKEALRASANGLIDMLKSQPTDELWDNFIDAYSKDLADTGGVPEGDARKLLASVLEKNIGSIKDEQMLTKVEKLIERLNKGNPSSEKAA